MLRTAAMAFGLLALPSVAAAQSTAEVDIGWLGYSGGMITQDLSVWNADLDPIKDVKITCRFFRAPDQLDQLGAGSVEIKTSRQIQLGTRRYRYRVRSPLAAHLAISSR